ncbi:MAG: archaeal proteasome endopeptidase complex subunit alpha [Candidatus Anstonellales archaeon]
MYGGLQQAYDRAITLFSPDGRLFQVEYAKEAVKKGATSIGLIGRDSVVLAAVKNVYSNLVMPDTIRKTFEIDNHIYAVAAGLIADARRLVDNGRYYAERHRLIYSEKPSVTSVARYMADVVQAYTQYGGGRPFGVSLLVGGIDNKPYLFEVEPSGALIGYYATSIGENKKEVDAYLEKNYKQDMQLNDLIKLAVKALKENVQAENIFIELVYYKQDMEKFMTLNDKEIKKFLES